MWFIGVEVEQETSKPLPKKNPASAPAAQDMAVPSSGCKRVRESSFNMTRGGG